MPTTIPTPVQPLPQLQICENCDAPLDGLQRYCLSCGARSRYVSNPALDHLVAKRKPPRIAPKSEVQAARDSVAGIPKDALPFLVGGVAIALVFGLLFGRALGGGNDNAALAAALAKQPAPVIQYAGAGPSGATAAAATPVASDFALDKGYAVQVATIPSTSDQAAVDAAKSAAASKGATDVGLINQSDHSVTPAPAADQYVIYSGQFKSKGDAEKALKKLKKAFPDAAVIAVKASAGGEGTVLAKGEDGKQAHSVKNLKADTKKVASDKKAVDDLQNKTGEDYREAQRKLPAEITIPVDPNAGSGPTGAGN